MFERKGRVGWREKGVDFSLPKLFDKDFDDILLFRGNLLRVVHYSEFE